MLAFGVGASVSPFFVSVAMRYLGPCGLYYCAVVIYMAMAVFTLYRMSRRVPVLEEVQSAFVI